MLYAYNHDMSIYGILPCIVYLYSEDMDITYKTEGIAFSHKLAHFVYE